MTLSEELRTCCAEDGECSKHNEGIYCLKCSAADYIEQLEAYMRNINEAYNRGAGSTVMVQIARKALEGMNGNQA